MRLIMARLGEIEENVRGILQGNYPSKLTENGLLQAKKLALRLKNEKISAIYSSDWARAVDTAKEIQKEHPKAELFLVGELLEKYQESLTSKEISEINWTKPSYTEKKDPLFARVKFILEKSFKEYPDKTVLFVSPEGLITIFMSLLLNKSIEEVKKFENWGHTALLIFDIKEGENTFINCDKRIK